MSRKIVVVARTGCGKDTLAKLLGGKQLISTTDRPRRFPGEATHVFVTTEEANKMTERVAETIINGYQYFATREQFDECDIYVIDPNGLDDLCKRAPDVPLCVVYIDVPTKIRRQRAIERAADPDEAAAIFNKRNASEDGQFTEFERLIKAEDKSEFLNAYPTAEVIVTIDNSKSDMDVLQKKAELVNMFNDQLDLGEDFGLHVYNI
jgi:guanylate kinase